MLFAATMLRTCLAAIVLLATSLAAVCSTPLQSAEPTGHVYVVLWFDTEDSILPASDDAAKRIADMLTAQGVRATFKVVGEKGRTLEARGRQDVIQALERHEIGYHSNTHSQHPTVAEYESKLDWEEGAAEFTRRERPGFEDLTRIFGKAPTCYGQPGSSWAPQAFAALKSWGVRVYLDDARQVGLDGNPFWYGGLLNIFNLKYGLDLRPNDSWSNLDHAKAHFQADYRELSGSGGGVVSIYFHPCEFIHREFWDAVNFAKGANPPRDQWKQPPMQSPQEIERNFKYLSDLVAYMKSFPEVRFVTASEALAVMPDSAQGHAFTRAELQDIAGHVGADPSFQVHEHYDLTASEVFELLNTFVAASVVHAPIRALRLGATPYGPSLPSASLTGTIEVPWDQFSRSVVDVAASLETRLQIPDVIWFGSTPVPPESYLPALARVAQRLLAPGSPPDSVTISPAHLAAARYVADDSKDLWDWIIFPPGFDAPELMAMAKLQAWTLKPARLSHRATDPLRH
jgi:peptidoglycan/xylan/chitin deacetylase (PgdA/CDA1 family)